MAQNKKRKRKNLWQFIRFNIAGFIFFWATYGLYFVFEQLLGWPSAWALATGSLIAHAIYFVLDKEWVFNAKGARKKTAGEMLRFAIFMSMNYFINLGIVLGLEQYGLTPYIGQFVAAIFFTFWNFFGLKIWVFHQPLALRPRRAK